MTSPKIIPTMTIPAIIDAFPQTIPVFERYGLRKDGYKALEYENLSATARVQQIDLETILSELNQAVS